MNFDQSFSSYARHTLLFDASGQLHYFDKPGSARDYVLPVYAHELACLASDQRLTLALLDDGHVYTWEEFTPSDFDKMRKPVRFPEGKKIVQISCGSDFGAATTEDGLVVTWGDNLFGQLGIAGTQSVEGPVTITLPGHVIQVACGCHHVLALLKTGEVYAWGRNDDGKIGIGTKSREVLEPRKVPDLENIIRVNAGAHHSIALGEGGSLYTWGWGHYNNTGLSHLEDETTPALLFPSGILAVASGWNHNLALHYDGSVSSFGNSMGTPPVLGPIKISLPSRLPAAWIGCTVYQFLVLDTAGTLFYWGSTDSDGVEALNAPREYTEARWMLPRCSWREWKEKVRWIFLGRSDYGSEFSVLPVEVIYHFVGVVIR
jgi:hypothetical protein